MGNGVFFCGKPDQQVLTRLYSSRSICFPYSLHANSCSPGCGASAASLVMKVEIYNEKKNPQIHCLIPHGVWLPSIKDVVKKLLALSFGL